MSTASEEPDGPGWADGLFPSATLKKAYVKDIEKLTGKAIPVVDTHPYPMAVFAVPPKETKPRPSRVTAKSSVKSQTKPKAAVRQKNGRIPSQKLRPGNLLIRRKKLRRKNPSPL